VVGKNLGEVLVVGLNRAWIRHSGGGRREGGAQGSRRLAARCCETGGGAEGADRWNGPASQCHFLFNPNFQTDLNLIRSFPCLKHYK
jgi:hypothetical protein